MQKKAVLSFSILLAAAWAAAGPWSDYSAKFENAQSLEEKVGLGKQMVGKDWIDPKFKDMLGSIERDEAISEEWMEKFESLIRLRAEAETIGGAPQSQTQEQIKAIKSSGSFRTVDERKRSNWLDRSFQRLGETISRLLQRRGQSSEPGGASEGAATAFMGVLQIIAIVIIGSLIGLFAFLVAKHFTWKASLRKKSRALLEDDEPDRTIDEWLEQADQLSNQGRYREAVRCLYLACLLRFDEAKVARFVRGETNWEHFRRISASPSMPTSIDFRTPTQKFDQIWYGYRTNGLPDVEAYRTLYISITSEFEKPKVSS